MNALILAIMSFAGFLLAYRFYATFLAEKIFALNPDAETPAHRFEDGVDHVPTLKSILFGHHFASIAGAAPIVGPAIGVIWGWLPAFLWVVFGTISLVLFTTLARWLSRSGTRANPSANSPRTS